jgi:prophage endopeptidase
MDDGACTRLTDATDWDYFTLRERIVTVAKHVDYLQGLITTQCLK